MKKKIVSLCLVICLIAIAIVGGTVAYFTDTDAKNNTFTMGKVDIALAEPSFDRLLGQETSLRVFPGETYAKDPTITVAADSEDCWLVATVTISDLAALKALYADPAGQVQATDIPLTALLSGGIINGTGYVAAAAEDNSVSGTMLSKEGNEVAFVTYTESVDTFVYTYYFKAAHSATAEEVLFEEVTIPAAIDNDTISDGTITVDVNAYAIQATGFNNVYEAYAAYTAQEG